MTLVDVGARHGARGLWSLRAPPRHRTSSPFTLSLRVLKLYTAAVFKIRTLVYQYESHAWGVA